MFCQNCGKPVTDGNEFCIYCGKKINIDVNSSKKTGSVTETENKSVHRKNNKWLWVFIAIIAFIVIGVITGMHLYPQYSYEKNISLGDKYLDELDYEDAILAYEAAIDIDSANVEAYLKLADTYLTMGDEKADHNYEEALVYYEKAEKVLEEAKKMVSSTDKQKIEKKSEKKTKQKKTILENENKTKNKTIDQLPREVVSESLGLEYVGNKEYQLQYYIDQDVINMTYPEERKILISAYKQDFDKDGEDEILSVILEREQNTDDGIIRLYMFEYISGGWHLVSEITKKTYIYAYFIGLGRVDVFLKEIKDKSCVLIECYGAAGMFTDGVSYELNIYSYNDGKIIEAFPEISDEGSDSPFINNMRNLSDAITDSPEEYEVVQNYIRSFNSLNLYPVSLGYGAPICETTSDNKLITRITRTDDSETWERDYNYPYGVKPGSNGFFGKISLILKDYSEEYK